MPTARRFLLGLLLLPALAAAQGDVVRAGTWNLEHYGRREPARTAEDRDAIAGLIRQMGVDVLALQEIDGGDELADLCRRLGDGWNFVIGSTGTFRGEGGQIGVGFVWNGARVELLSAEELLELPREWLGNPVFHRVPVTACFRAKGGGLDFRAVTVHMKAGRGPKNEAKRRSEAALLRGWLDEVQRRDGEDLDIVVLGDFNHTYGAPAFEVMTAGGGLRYLEPTERGPTIVHFDDPIDHVAIGPGLEDEVSRGALRVHRVALEALGKDAWRARYSDHLPVVVELRAKVDGDPGATFRPVGEQQWLRAGGASAAMTAVRAAAVEGAATPSEAAADPFGAGSTVVVKLRYGEIGKAVRGRLLAPLAGEWVRLMVDGRSVAYPISRVASVEAVH